MRSTNSFSAGAPNAAPCASDRLLIFARAPQPERVKTRLAAAIGAVNAANFYAAMLRDTLQMARQLQSMAAQQTLEVCLAFTPHHAFDAGPHSLSAFWQGARVAQSDGDLGQRMFEAIGWARAQGAQNVILIGSDAPDLPAALVIKAWQLLRDDATNFVLSPAQDGGFTLLGCHGALPLAMFAGIDWTQPLTLAPVLENAARLSLKTELIESWSDVDDGDDARALWLRLQHHPWHAPHCARWLREAGCKYLQPA